MTMSVKELIKKGDGLLSRRSGVWTYPGCANDTSGTNLVLPLEYVSDVEVQKALADGDIVAAVMSPAGVVTSVRLAAEDAPAVILAGQAGTPEMGTEWPEGARVESDAGAGPVKARDVEKQVLAAAADAARVQPAAADKPAAHRGKS
jgi:hypothetical protein